MNTLIYCIMILGNAFIILLTLITINYYSFFEPYSKLIVLSSKS